MRNYVDIVEKIRIENGREVNPPTRRAAAIAVIRTPFAGVCEDDLGLLTETGDTLGKELS